MQLETKRLILRPWLESDAEDLFRYASAPDVGPMAGWPPHTSVENSLEIIRGILSEPETYAVVLKSTGIASGAISIMIGETSNKCISENEGEIGYWLGKPFWGQGLMPEAVEEMMRYGFMDLGLEKIWCAYFDGNEKSKRVQEKCGFVYKYTEEDVYCPLLDETRVEHINCITKKEWEKRVLSAV